MVDVGINEGDRVQEADLILPLEAIKMEIRTTALVAGIVIQLHIDIGDQVEWDQTLAKAEPKTDG